MLACVYPAENFKTKTVTVKLRHGKSRKKPKLLSVKERTETPGVDTPLNNELPVGGGGAVLVLSELESMAARQQREIAQQRRLLEQREARLAVLRGAQEPAQQDRLARLRHRLDQQQSKLNRLRLLRSQTDQSRANNATLTSDLDCIRALFNEKEKELSLAVAKVEELTRQLEELRGRHNNGAGHLTTPASAELEKLRRELMYRNKMNEQQNQVVSQQRLALVQRQAEMASIDARIAQLQGRLQRKRALNQRLSQQLGSSNRAANNPAFADSKLDFNNSGKSRPAGNIAAIEPYSHIPNDNDFTLNKSDPKYQTLPYNTKFTVNFKAAEDDVNKNKIQHSASASQIGQRSFQQFGHQIAHSQSQSHIQGQSQLLGANQQQTSPQGFVGQPGNVLSTNNNGNNNNNNNNNNNGHNYPQETQQNLRLHGHQQHNTQQKQHSSTNSSNSSLASGQSITQNQNHRNLQTHQKPVSSVAPSFPVKSPIYQTSSTKIHPVMPQTLSLIGRGHSGTQGYTGLNSQSNGPQGSQGVQGNPVPQEQGFALRHNFPGMGNQHATQSGSQVATGTSYQTQIQGNLQHNPSHMGQNPNFTGYTAHGYNQTQSGLNTGNQGVESSNDRVKFESKSEKYEHLLSGKHEQSRYDQNLMKYDNQHGKYDQNNQQSKHEQSSGKHESISGKYENQMKHDLHGKFDHTQKYEHPQFKHEHQSTKYDHNQQFKHEPMKYEGAGTQQFKQDQVKYDQNPSKLDHLTGKYEQGLGIKHDHGVKFEPPGKLPDKPYEFERLKDIDRKQPMGFVEAKGEDKTKPALPPKPSKPNPPPRLTHHEKIEISSDVTSDGKASITVGSRLEKEEEIPPIPTSEPPESPTETQIGTHQIIKARPLTLKKPPLSEQPKLRYAKSNVHVSINRRIEMPPAFLFPETEIPADLMQTEQQQQQISESTDIGCKKPTSVGNLIDDGNEKLEDSDIVDALNVINIEDKLKAKVDTERRPEFDGDGKTDVIRRKKGNLKSTTGKANLSRRVSFDPLALLLDASLEGELELVKKTAKEVANPSSANDEGITALHNAICAGHLEIVKFLVEFGCDVNAQDSDGWTPLHCAASCNNLAMVRFLVEHGACIFATTLSDHETAAEKCEEDEEGFDGCSEYLYSVQEKLGIMNNGQVFAVFDYEAQHTDELTLKNGDSLVVLRKGDDNEREWWWSKLGHREGYVPRNLLGLYPRVQPAKVD
ncbi:probable basic-leucine zipper transcription factor N isoform X2 [Cephus cinctus]|uniref:Probable basic-leucine zipper transcription factor N isoform X2 n=1 Tax=Cephus cinctus TaxID=211228 RepID=A0AAJ7RGD4_CEPCN|nr:probable basic-leucine zipper transcription factor N isoform X2 [Cephus cinctus]XP_015594110.1 probable basic-leucine zipper transcription factor N isoform X2 [Cephus cinctus]XP_024940123.1 probable basic-leucine zipper transcription factor N isoform X2 [Cephus cinctus]XP_024940124.1 probable basic-leucine zipper transcription factor N isoform X2 [Cephus cinctus]